MPWPEPVTTATRFSKRTVFLLILWVEWSTGAAPGRRGSVSGAGIYITYGNMCKYFLPYAHYSRVFYKHLQKSDYFGQQDRCNSPPPPKAPAPGRQGGRHRAPDSRRDPGAGDPRRRERYLDDRYLPRGGHIPAHPVPLLPHPGGAAGRGL